MPCPVCGSKTHPSLAKKTAKAPSEAQLNSAKKSADDARKDEMEKSQTCSNAIAEIGEQKNHLEKQLKDLDLSIDIVRAYTETEDAIENIDLEIASLNNALLEENSRIQRKRTLDKEIPKKDNELKDLKQALEKSNKEIISLETEIKTKGDEVLKNRENLSFDNKQSAEKRIKDLDGMILGIKKAIKKAEEDFYVSDKKIEGLRAAIAEMENQLSQKLDFDLDAENTKKEELTESQKAVEDYLNTLLRLCSG